MKRRPVLLMIASALLLLGSLYCFSAYAMNASFSVVGDRGYYEQMAIRWGTAGLILMVAAVGAAAWAWRAKSG
jgi:hypothetical protein